MFHSSKVAPKTVPHVEFTFDEWILNHKSGPSGSEIVVKPLWKIFVFKGLCAKPQVASGQQEVISFA